VIFSGTDPKWDVPILRSDMLVDALPSPLDSWAGSATRDNEDPEQWWLYNYGVDSTSGMLDTSKIIMAFYTHDKYFEGWWGSVHRQVMRMLNAKIGMAVMPNFSPGGPRAWGLWQTFKSFYIARYMQEAGIRVIPDLETTPDFLDLSCTCIPPKAPWVAVQVQNTASKMTMRPTQEEEAAAWAEWAQIKREQFKRLTPQHVLLYGTTKGRDRFEALALGVPFIWLEARTDKLHRAYVAKQATI
jgi:hypothetical protein